MSPEARLRSVTWLATAILAVVLGSVVSTRQAPPTAAATSPHTTEARVRPPADRVAVGSARDAEFDRIVRPFIDANCIGCHDSVVREAGLDLDAAARPGSVAKDRDLWEQVFRRLKHGEMPPSTEPRPDPADIKAVTRWLVAEFDRHDRLAPPYVGRVAPRRLNRTEYNNTVRDLLGVELRPADDFPADDSGYGFDNNGDVLSLSPLLMEKYLKAAEKVARTAVFGVEPLKPSSYTHQPWYIDFDTTRVVKEDYDETGLSLPYALHVMHRAPVEADYDLTAIMRGFRVVGANPGRLGFWIDGKLVHEGSVEGRDDGEMNGQSATFRARLTAGEHWLAVSILKMYEGLPPAYGGPNPNQSTARVGKSPSEHFVSNLVVNGPFNQVMGPTPDSLRKIYGTTPPKGGKVSAAHARQIVGGLARRAYRRPVAARELDELVGLVALAQKSGDSFEDGLALAITRMLVSPTFLFRIERNPPPGPPRAVNTHELAARLSYFLWSSMPDAALSKAADAGTLTQPAVLAAEVRRMIADPKSAALVENFGGQWLQFRALESHTLERKQFQQYTDYTRMSMEQETRRLFDHIMREDRPVVEFITADYSFLNQRLAEYYGIPGVEGAEFRRVQLPAASQRRGVLTHASVLTVSSYANRTSPVIRGKWVLENLLNAAPPPPPGDVPSLKEEGLGKSTTVRQELEAHRDNRVCASCHSRMDPLGFGLENFSAIGQWRDKDGTLPIDASGTLPDGRRFNGPTELVTLLDLDKDVFAEALSDKLLTYALGRGLTAGDAGAVRRMAARIAADQYRFSSLVLGVVTSPQFLMRARAETTP